MRWTRSIFVFLVLGIPQLALAQTDIIEKINKIIEHINKGENTTQDQRELGISINSVDEGKQDINIGVPSLRLMFPKNHRFMLIKSVAVLDAIRTQAATNGGLEHLFKKWGLFQFSFVFGSFEDTAARVTVAMIEDNNGNGNSGHPASLGFCVHPTGTSDYLYTEPKDFYKLIEYGMVHFYGISKLMEMGFDHIPTTLGYIGLSYNVYLAFLTLGLSPTLDNHGVHFKRVKTEEAKTAFAEVYESHNGEKVNKADLEKAFLAYKEFMLSLESLSKDHGDSVLVDKTFPYPDKAKDGFVSLDVYDKLKSHKPLSTESNYVVYKEVPMPDYMALALDRVPASKRCNGNLNAQAKVAKEKAPQKRALAK